MTVCTFLMFLRGFVDVFVLPVLSSHATPDLAVRQLTEGLGSHVVGRHQRSLAELDAGQGELPKWAVPKEEIKNNTKPREKMPGAPSSCQEMNFEKGVEYLGVELLAGVRNSKETSPEACCQRCELLEDCTHWSWTADSVCSIRHGRLARTANTKLGQSITSGKVSLNSYVDRVHNLNLLKEGDSVRIEQARKAAERMALINPVSDCKFDPEDGKHLQSPNASKPTSYIVLNEARSGSSWLQEISQMHPGILVQFELDLPKADAALRCMQCSRPKVPVSKNVSRLPAKLHPPQACGLTAFASANRFPEVEAAAARHNASLVILLRRNHVAHAVSNHRHFTKPAADGLILWDARELARSVDDSRQAYFRLLAFAGRAAAAGRPVHLLFYEDLKRHPAEVWAGLQAFLGLPPVHVPEMESLERKSSNRPAVNYLKGLESLRADPAVAAAEWASMLTNPKYDEEVFDSAAAFRDACGLYTGARLSWRGGVCSDVVDNKVA